jgi:penicillin amidase
MEAEWQSYSPDTKAIATSFVQGVNAFIRQCGGRLPVEFELLGFRPGEWKPEHCLLRIAGLLMIRNLTLEIARAEMVAKLGVTATQRFMPTEPFRRLDPDPEVDFKGLDRRVLEGYRAAISIPTLYQGSNNWVVDGTLTHTGKPLLASDPHRPVILPSLRYIVHLNGPGWNVIGGGEPALPGVAIGHNERAAWGFTIVPFDAVDAYIERTSPQNPNRYAYQGQWLDMRVEREQIRVKGQAQPVEVELKYTRHGPVLWEDPNGHRALAIRWTGQEPGTAGYLGSLALDRAGTWDQFLGAVARWKLPAENMIYADAGGDIGWIAGGLMPVRENWTGLLPVPGHSGRYEWKGYRTIEQLPQVRNPKRHYVATANHNILPPDYPYDLAFDWAVPYRFERIDEVLGAGGKFTAADFQRLQHDETSLPARQLAGMLARLPAGDPPNAQAARKLLADWDHILSKDSAAALLFEVWLQKLKVRYLSSQVSPEHLTLVSANLGLWTVIRLLLEAPGDLRERVFLESLEEAWKETQQLAGEDLAAWRWGKLHTITFRHPLARTGARKAVFDRGPVERGGDSYTPNATGGPDYRQNAGASYRHIVDLADWDRSVFTSTPGQSGQPGSPYYDNLLPLWAKHQYAPLVFSQKAVEASLGHRLVLQPSAPR